MVKTKFLTKIKNLLKFTYLNIRNHIFDIIRRFNFINILLNSFNNSEAFQYINYIIYAPSANL